MNRVIAFAGYVLASFEAVAQTPLVVHTLRWIEVDVLSHAPVSNPNGSVEAGEAVRVSLSASFTPVGTPVAFQIPEPGGVAPIAGMASSAFSLIADNAQGGVWTNVVVRHGLQDSGLNLSQPNGTFHVLGFGQPHPSGGVLPIATNPLPDVWEAVWTPSIYSPRIAAFEIVPPTMIPGGGPLPPAVYVSLGSPQGIPLFGRAVGIGQYDSVQIPIIPTPGAAAALGLGLVLMQGRGLACGLRRRRRVG